jgi:hypothetical protein
MKGSLIESAVCTHSRNAIGCVVIFENSAFAQVTDTTAFDLLILV